MTQLWGDTLTEACAHFEEFLQGEIALFEREIWGFRYWHFIRFSVFVEIVNRKGWFERLGFREQASAGQKIKAGLDLAINSLRFSINGDDSRCPILVLNSSNRILINGRYQDPYIDTWLPDSLLGFTTWEAPLVWRHRPHHGRQDLFFLDNLLLQAQLKRMTIRGTAKKIRDEAGTILRFARELGVELSLGKVYSMLTYVLALDSACRHTIRTRLQLKQPKCLIVVNHYDPLKMLIAEIAKSQGIYVIEMQHGNMGKYHVAYNFKYDKSLPALPDEIFAFGEFWCETTRIRHVGVRMTATGFPYLDGRISGLAMRMWNNPREKVKVLIISQDTIGVELARVALVLSQKLPPENYEIVFKIHPREFNTWQDRYPPELQTSGVKVVASADLYQLLVESDIHIGVYSTAVMESLAFGKMLILYESYGVHFYEHLITTGRAHLASDPDAVLALVTAAKPPQSRVITHDMDYYWARDSKNKAISRLREILSAHE